jgi:4-amino-4-deoxy-L-arabinose transferase-like glycosyltransferase
LRPGAVLIAVVAAALALRLFDLGGESLWLDEGVAVRMASLPMQQTLAATAADVHPPLYRALLHVVILLIGRSEWAVRLLSALAGALAVFLLARIGMRLCGAFVGLGAAALLAISPLAIRYAQDATSYSLYMCLALASWFCFLRWLEGRRPIDGAGYVVATVALLYTHNTAWFVLAAQWLAFGLAPVRAPATRAGLARDGVILQAVVIAAYAPWVPVLVRQMRAVQKDFWIPSPTLRTLVSTLLDYAGSPWMLGALGLAVLAGLARVRPRDGEPQTAWPAPRLVVAPWLVLPVAGPFLASFIVAPIFLTRVTLAALPAACLLAMRGLSALRGPAWRAAGTALLALGITQPLVSYYREPNKERWREAVADLQKSAAPGDLVLVHAGFCKVNVVDYYMRRRDLDVVPFPAGHSTVAPADVEALGRLISGRHRVWLLRSHAGERGELIAETIARALPRIDEHDYHEASFRWSHAPSYVGVALVRYEEAGSDTARAPVTRRTP